MNTEDERASRPRPRTVSADDQRLVDRYVAGRSLSQVAAEFGVSPNKVTNALKRAGVPRRPGGASPKHRLGHPERVAERYGEGLSKAAVAAEFGVSVWAVTKALKTACVPTRRAGEVSPARLRQSFAPPTWVAPSNEVALDDRLAYNMRALRDAGVRELYPGPVGRPTEFWDIIADSYHSLIKAGVPNPIQGIVAAADAAGLTISRDRVAMWVKSCRDRGLLTHPRKGVAASDG